MKRPQAELTGRNTQKLSHQPGLKCHHLGTEELLIWVKRTPSPCPSTPPKIRSSVALLRGPLPLTTDLWQNHECPFCVHRSFFDSPKKDAARGNCLFPPVTEGRWGIGVGEITSPAFKIQTKHTFFGTY